MKQEEKDLLLKDLCARVPYGVKVKFKTNGIIENKENFIYNEDGEYEYITNGKSYLTLDIIKALSNNYLDEIKPYLFPLTNMTDEQKEIYCQLQQRVIYNSKGFVTEDVMNFINWCYENHLDINDLIPKGLAIDATNLNIYLFGSK